jgi:diguanylate cyclase (GGDEF)-like protein
VNKIPGPKGHDGGDGEGDDLLVDCLARLVQSLTREAGRVDAVSLEAAQAALRAAQRTTTAVVDLKARLRELETSSRTDGLTGVLNRQSFETAFTGILASARRYREGGVIAFIDLDDFKTINDIHGHAAGDALLRHTGRLLSTQVRESDIVGRMGGDEFAVVLSRSPRREGIARAHGLETTINTAAMTWQGRDLPIRASFGIHAFAPDDEAPAILAHADQAMYRSKRQRNGQPRPAVPGMFLENASPAP